MEPVLDYSSGTLYASQDNGRKTILSGVSFSVCPGERMALIGETGSGKTMLALSVMGLLPPGIRQEGACIRFCGKETSKSGLRSLLGLDVAYIPQNGHEFLNPAQTVAAQLGDSLLRAGARRSEIKAKVREKLSQVGLPDIGDKYPFQLSGGMAQRVTIAMALCSEAKLIIADEPTNGLDSRAADEMTGLLDRLFPDAAMLFITHDISFASGMDKVTVICSGRMMEQGDRSVLENPRSPYTRGLLDALAANGMKSSPKLRTQEGDCPFYGRCPNAEEECLKKIGVQSEGSSRWRCIR